MCIRDRFIGTRWWESTSGCARRSCPTTKREFNRPSGPWNLHATRQVVAIRSARLGASCTWSGCRKRRKTTCQRREELRMQRGDDRARQNLFWITQRQKAPSLSRRYLFSRAYSLATLTAQRPAMRRTKTITLPRTPTGAADSGVGTALHRRLTTCCR